MVAVGELAMREKLFVSLVIAVVSLCEAADMVLRMFYDKRKNSG